MGSGREGDGLTIRRHPRLDRYQFGSMVCALIFLDNVLRKMGGPGKSIWWWLASGRTEVILLSVGLMLTSQLLFWSGIVLSGNRGSSQSRKDLRKRATSRLSHM